MCRSKRDFHGMWFGLSPHEAGKYWACQQRRIAMGHLKFAQQSEKIA